MPRSERENLRILLERYQSLVDQSPLAIIRLDTEGRVLGWNRACEAMFGWTAAEVLGRNLQTENPDKIDEIRANVQKMNAGESISGLVTHRRHKDGSRVPVRLFISPLRDKSGKAVELVGMYENLTESARSAEQLREKQESLNLALDAATAGVWSYNLATREMSWDDRVLDIFQAGGVAPEKRQDFLRNAIDPQDRIRLQERFNSIVREKLHLVETFCIRLLDGRIRFISLRGDVLKNEKGEVERVMGLCLDDTEKVQAAAELKQKTEELDMFFDVSPDLFCIADTEGVIHRLNPAWTKVLGYPVKEMEGQRFIEFVHPEDVGTTLIELRKLGEGKVVSNFINRYRCKEGAYRWVEWRSVPYQEKLIFAAARDITDRIESDKRIMETRDRAQKYFDIVAVILLILDSNGRIADLNQTGCRILGHQRENVLGLDWVDNFVPAEDRDRLREYFRQIMNGRTGFVEYDENTVINSQGQERIIAWHTTQIRGNDGRVAFTLSSGEDITDRKLAEEALLRSERTLESILRTIPDIVYRLDPEGKILFINDAVRNYGYTPEKMLGRGILEFVHPEDRQRAVHRINERRTRERRTRSLEIRLMQKSGESMDFEVHSEEVTQEQPVFLIDAEGLYQAEKPNHDSFIGTQGVARDITERKKLEQQQRELESMLSHSQKMESVGRLAGGVAHDFNNLLTVIIGSLELAKVSAPKDGITGGTDDSLEDALKAAERARDLTRQLLAFGHKQVLSVKTVGLNEVVLGFTNILSRVIGENIRVETFLRAAPDMVEADISQLEQVLLNLAVNARDAMSGGGILTLETGNVDLDEEYARTHPEAAPGEYVQLAVSDTGCGMDEGLRRRIFEPFFTTKNVGFGTGLGLSMVYGIVKQHGGSIWVYSEVGVGSTFKIYLPRAASGAVAAGGQPRAESRRAEGESVLVVEDDPTVRETLRQLLGHLGYHALIAANVEEAVVLANANSPLQVLLTDVILQGGTGRDVLEKVRAIHPEVRPVFMSGYTDDVIAHHGVLDQGVLFLQKPFNAETLHRKLREALGG
ncbi:PAS domain S-box protein [bacterium]|nr:PAS domain S-box protein [bacterium]